VIPTGLSVVFALLGLTHVYWACGGRLGAALAVPEKDGQPLFVPRVLGTSVVAFLLFGAALVILGREGLFLRALPRGLFTASTWALSFVFLVRAIGDFRFVGFFKGFRSTRFGFWDTWLFSPLCLALALGCAYVATGG
jgi:hypothetical protein